MYGVKHILQESTYANENKNVFYWSATGVAWTRIFRSSCRINSRHLSKDTLIYTPGYPSDLAFIVKRGRARIYLSKKGKEFSLAPLEPGDICATHTHASVQTMEQLAAIVGFSRQTVSTIVTNMLHAEVLQSHGRGLYRITNIDLLKGHCHSWIFFNETDTRVGCLAVFNWIMWYDQPTLFVYLCWITLEIDKTYLFRSLSLW